MHCCPPAISGSPSAGNMNTHNVHVHVPYAYKCSVVVQRACKTKRCPYEQVIHVQYMYIEKLGER